MRCSDVPAVFELVTLAVYDYLSESCSRAPPHSSPDLCRLAIQLVMDRIEPLVAKYCCLAICPAGPACELADL